MRPSTCLHVTTVAAAACVYLWAAGCAIFAHPDPTTHHHPPPALITHHSELSTSALLPLRAVGIQLQRADWTDKYLHALDEIADLGADAVKLVVDSRQENGTSTRIYVDQRMTPSSENLARIITHAKSRGLRVILMPIVLLDAPKGDEWRGTLRPDSWNAWFESYRDMLAHFLWVAEAHDVDVFVVGSELVSSERHARHWNQTITFVRERFSGKLTYSANWDHYQSVPFWNELDFVGMNSYWTLGDSPDVSAARIADNWQPVVRELETFLTAAGKPLLFLEVGWCSLDNAASEPWDYTRDVPINLDLQARLYQAFFDVWHGHPRLAGFSVWEWPPGSGGPEDRGYSPRAKPAEAVLRTWLSEDPWTVSVP